MSNWDDVFDWRTLPREVLAVALQAAVSDLCAARGKTQEDALVAYDAYLTWALTLSPSRVTEDVTQTP